MWMNEWTWYLECWKWRRHIYTSITAKGSKCCTFFNISWNEKSRNFFSRKYIDHFVELTLIKVEIYVWMLGSFEFILLMFELRKFSLLWKLYAWCSIFFVVKILKILQNAPKFIKIASISHKICPKKM